jgi:hypothetical protein
MTQGTDINKLIQLMVPVMIDLTRQQMELFIVRGILHREPTPWELQQYRDELYWRGVAQRLEDSRTAPQRIHDYVWGGS